MKKSYPLIINNQIMLVEVNIKNYNITGKYYTFEFDNTCSFDKFKETYLHYGFV